MSYKLYRRDGGTRWHAYFIDRDGHRHRLSTKQTDKRRAVVVADGWYQRLADPTYDAAHHTSIQAASQHLIAALKRAKRSVATTGHFYPTKLGHLYRVWGEDMPLARIDAKLVDKYIETREAEGASQHTISKELTALRMLLRHARRRGEFALELSQVMPIGFGTGYVPRTRRLTIEEACALIAALPPNVARYVAFVLCTTARDAAVARARGRHVGRLGIAVFDLKTKGSSRTVPGVEFLFPFLAAAFWGLADDEPLCPGVGSVRHALDRATKRLGMPHVSPNDLRRSVAHWLLERGVPRDAAAAFMGHANTKMLDAVYGKLDSKELGASITRALAAAPGSSVEGTWQAGSVSVDAVAVVDDDTAVKPCAGTESNRRHGDFQSPHVHEDSAEKPHETCTDVSKTWQDGDADAEPPLDRLPLSSGVPLAPSCDLGVPGSALMLARRAMAAVWGGRVPVGPLFVGSAS